MTTENFWYRSELVRTGLRGHVTEVAENGRYVKLKWADAGNTWYSRVFGAIIVPASTLELTQQISNLVSADVSKQKKRGKF